MNNETRNGHDVRRQYPDRVPVVMKKHTDCKYELDKSKYLVPNEMTFMQFMFVIRKRLRIEPSEAIFVFCKGKLLCDAHSMNQLYNTHCDEDGYMCCTYASENAFGR